MKDSNPDAFEQTAADTTRAKADAFVRSMMRWHFEPETGTDFWLAMRDHLDFDPLRDVESFDDLKRFPDVSEHLRRTPVDALAPRGLKGQLQPLVFESGGTSGKPKHVVAYEEWMRELVDWRIARYVDRPNRPRGHTLAAVPTGPHIVGAVNRIRAQRLGGMVFSIDLDPRWVKRQIRAGAREVAKDYRDHLVDQIADVVEAQDIRFLVTTPPILTALLERGELLERLRASLAQVTLGGTTIDIDEIHFAAAELLPDCEFSASYGSTSALGEASSDLITAQTRRIEYRSFSPFNTYDVIDPSSGETIGIGERGTVTVSHVSRYAFYPRVLERDTAIRCPKTDDSVGDRIANIAPVAETEGRKVVEGVY